PDARCFGLGPYLLAAVEGDVLVAFEGACPVRLAVRVAGGWAVDGLDGVTFPTVRFVPRGGAGGGGPRAAGTGPCTPHPRGRRPPNTSAGEARRVGCGRAIPPACRRA